MVQWLGMLTASPRVPGKSWSFSKGLASGLYAELEKSSTYSNIWLGLNPSMGTCQIPIESSNPSDIGFELAGREKYCHFTPKPQLLFLTWEKSKERDLAAPKKNSNIVILF
jgi:hypothetical protein